MPTKTILSASGFVTIGSIVTGYALSEKRPNPSEIIQVSPSKVVSRINITNDAMRVECNTPKKQKGIGELIAQLSQSDYNAGIRLWLEIEE